MSRREVVDCDACERKDIGFGCTTEVGMAYPKPVYDLCERCRAEMFPVVARYLDQEGVNWLVEALENRQSNLDTYCDPT